MCARQGALICGPKPMPTGKRKDAPHSQAAVARPHGNEAESPTLAWRPGIACGGR